MAKNRSAAYNTMRGGQIVFHYLRMTAQVVKKNLYVFGFAMILSTFAFGYFLSSAEDYQRGTKWVMSLIKTEYLWGGDDVTTVTLSDGRAINTTWSRIYHNQGMRSHFQALKADLYLSFWLSVGLTLMLLCGWFYYLKSWGVKEGSDDFLRGGMLGDLRSHMQKLKADEKETGVKSRLKIAGVPMPPKADVTSIALIGSPGTGKSATILDLLAQQRELGTKNLVLDPSGDFTRKFYREGVDIILSPRDKRTVCWDVWAEGETAESYNITSSSLIKEEREGDMWARAARFVFDAVCERLSAQSKASGEPPSMKKLANYILRVDDKTLIDIVRFSDAKSILNDKSEKTAASIRTTLSTFLQPLAKLPQTGERFSFSDWVRRDDDSWVFVPLMPKHRAYYRPVLTMWMEHYTMAVLSLPTGVYNWGRYNLICDELPSYNKIPSLLMFLAEARKYGGNSILGFQNRSQLEAVYGPKDASAIEGLVGTFGVFRCNSNADSEWSSKLLLTSELEKSSESLSIGSKDVRDSVSVSRSTRDHRLVTPSEIVNLPDLTLYLRFGRGYDILKVKQQYPELPDVAEPLDVISDEEISQQNCLDHYDQTRGKKAESETLGFSDEEVADAEYYEDSGASDVPPDYEEFAARINMSAVEENEKAAPKESHKKGDDKSTDTASDFFTRGF